MAERHSDLDARGRFGINRLSAIQEKRDGAIVDECDLHHRAKTPVAISSPEGKSNSVNRW